MKVNILDAHDRKQHFIKDQQNTISQGVQDCLLKNPLSLALQEHSPYIYIFAHPRTDEDGVTKRMLWQPRLKRPKAQTNSYLFRANSKTDVLEICWMIPPREMFKQYDKGNMLECDLVAWSIAQFEHSRNILEAPLADDLSDERIKQIYISVANNMEKKTNASLPFSV